ncbi:Fibronectin type III domain protein, partial [human gut metagenome]
MKKKFVRLISAVLSAAMTLTAVPLSAFAEGEGHTHDGESNVITTPLDFREKTADESGDGWSWDYDTKTLTLDGVNIQATTDSMSVVTV